LTSDEKMAKILGVSFDAETGVLYVADSESSSIRSMHLVSKGC